MEIGFPCPTIWKKFCLDKESATKLFKEGSFESKSKKVRLSLWSARGGQDYCKILENI